MLPFFWGVGGLIFASGMGVWQGWFVQHEPLLNASERTGPGCQRDRMNSYHHPQTHFALFNGNGQTRQRCVQHSLNGKPRLVRRWVQYVSGDLISTCVIWSPDKNLNPGKREQHGHDGFSYGEKSAASKHWKKVYKWRPNPYNVLFWTHFTEIHTKLTWD